MLEYAIKGDKKYYGWIVFLLGVIGVGFGFYLWQLKFGLGITGLGRDVSWGFYIAQLTYMVGVAAGGVMVVLPYYLHDYKAFGRITIMGEFLAIASLIVCMLSVLVDLGQPMRVLNVILNPQPRSMLFYDMLVLNGYLLLNLIIGWNVLQAERNGTHYPMWVKPLIYLSIPFAISIHTVTAFLILRPARPRLLADGDSGTALPGLGLRRRTGPAHPAEPPYPACIQFRSRPGADPNPGQNIHLRPHCQPVLLRL